MKNKGVWLVLSILILVTMVLASCNTSTSVTTQAQSTMATTSTTTAAPTTTSTTVATTKPTTGTTATTGNWWDSLGTPQYGGTLTIRVTTNITGFDPALSSGTFTIYSAWLERLHADDWTLNPSVFDYTIAFRPYQYVKGWLGESWEFTDASTYVVHLHQGIHWQNIPPANGREFVADDVVFNYDRLLGTGHGFTKSPPGVNATPFKDLISLTAPDKYTVVFKWRTSNPEFINETLQGDDSIQHLANPEAVTLWGNVTDWHHAVGTGPFIMQDLVGGSSATLTRNPNYWGHDERYPQNQLPYIDTLKLLIIPDTSTALAAMRTAKLDVMDGLSIQNAQSMKKTNPDILQKTYPLLTSYTIDPRNDVKPYSDVRVRQALQMAIDLPTIASTYYQGLVDPYPTTLTSYYEKGWGFPYNQWPQDLKDQYAYNPTAAKKLLADAGYPSGFKTDIVVDSTNFDMDLLQIVKSYFTAIGVDMDIRTMDPGAWTDFVQTNHKEDALFTRTGNLGQSTEPLRQLLRFTTGYSSNTILVNDPTYNAFYTSALAANNIDDIKKILTSANEYVSRQHFCISLIHPKLFALYQPWLKGYNCQYFGVSGPNVGILLLGFYPARFWVDQNMKKSMGH